MLSHQIAMAGRHRWRIALAALASLAALAALPAAGLAASSADSTATLLWTAPGDDGTTGVAAQYDLRFRTTAISGTDTLSWWNAATRVTGLPAPGPAGATDSVQVRGLTPAATYYFILRTADEVPNWSNFSNVAIRLPYSDVIAPAAINDLNATSSEPTGPPPTSGRPALPMGVQGTSLRR